MYIIIMMTISFIGAAVFLISSYLGFFLEVHLQKRISEPLHLIYQEYLGPYHESVPTLLKVEKWAKANGVPCEKTFGQYFDDPNIVDSDRLRSHVGCVTSVKSKSIHSPFKFKTIEAREVLQAVFSGSPAIGPIKVYPAAQEWLKNNGYKSTESVIEMHLVGNEQKMITTYHFPVEKITEDQSKN